MSTLDWMQLANGSSEDTAKDSHTEHILGPKGTYYWGGAGLDGAYIKPTLQSFRDAGIENVYNGADYTPGTFELGSHGMPLLGSYLDAARSATLRRYSEQGAIYHFLPWSWSLPVLTNDSIQFNLIGYSYGSLIAAQIADRYAIKAYTVDHLVLIGSPISSSFLKEVRGRPSIKHVHIIDLTDHGDLIHAGMSEWELLRAVPTLKDQAGSGKSEGHFYYDGNNAVESPSRWRDLAKTIYDFGLR